MKAGITIVDADGHVLDNPSMYRQYLEAPYNAHRDGEIYPMDGFARSRGGHGGRHPKDAQEVLADMEVEGSTRWSSSPRSA